MLVKALFAGVIAVIVEIEQWLKKQEMSMSPASPQLPNPRYVSTDLIILPRRVSLLDVII